MLTTYERCKNHEDQLRCDPKEGRCDFAFTHGNMGISGIHTAGTHCYLLCGSTTESSDLIDYFKVDNYLVINDVLGFSDAISRYIPGFVSGKFGSCEYSESRLISKKSPNLHDKHRSNVENLFALAQNGNHEKLEGEFKRVNSEFRNNIELELDDAAFFIKDKSFAKESEFRMIWQTPYKTLKPLHIICPEAVKFCTFGKPLSRDINPPKFESDGHMSTLSGYTEPQPDKP